MTSWYKNILTNTTSQLSSLQSRLLQSENDGDTEDDTHVCRVLRAYYTQEQRPFPGWLPPDPKAPPPVAPVYAQPQVGARYGAAAAGGGQPNGQPSLSSLWDRNAAQQGQNAPPSLRQGRGGPQQQQQQQQRLSPFAQGPGDDRPASGGRTGSYQSGSVYSQGSTGAGAPPAPAGGGSAQDRLKQRLWGGGARTTSPAAGSQGPFQPPNAGGGGGGGGGGDYEDRFAPGGQYDARGGGERAYAGSNSPWSSNEPAYGGGGAGGRPPQGLPSGPRRQGLPSGPRMR